MQDPITPTSHLVALARLTDPEVQDRIDHVRYKLQTRAQREDRARAELANVGNQLSRLKAEVHFQEMNIGVIDLDEEIAGLESTQAALREEVRHLIQDEKAELDSAIHALYQEQERRQGARKRINQGIYEPQLKAAIPDWEQEAVTAMAKALAAHSLLRVFYGPTLPVGHYMDATGLGNRIMAAAEKERQTIIEEHKEYAAKMEAGQRQKFIDQHTQEGAQHEVSII